MIGGLEPGTALLLLAGVAAALDRGLALVSRFAGHVAWFKRWDRQRARDIVTHEDRAAALERIAELHEPLIALAQRAEAIEASVGVNGKPVHDRLTEFGVQLREVRTEVGEIKEWLDAATGWMRNHEELHAAAGAEERGT